MTKKQPRRAYKRGDRVRDIHTGEEYTVIRDAYWQHYAGGDTSDYTVPLSPTESQPTPWNKSTNLEPIGHTEEPASPDGYCQRCHKHSYGPRDCGGIWDCPDCGARVLAGSQARADHPAHK